MRLLGLILGLWVLHSSMQTVDVHGAEEPIRIDQLDVKKLENLIQTEINTIRQAQGLQPLQTHEALQKAADDQAKYIAKKGSLSHKQPSAKKAKTRDRVEFYGGKMRGVGENTAFIKLLTPAIFKGEHGKLDTLTISTYEQAAHYIVSSWMNSPPHKANILFESYEFSGLKVAYNKSINRLFAVQVFGLDYEK